MPDLDYLSATIDFLNREDGAIRTVMCYPITKIVLYAPIGQENPSGEPKRTFIATKEGWAEETTIDSGAHLAQNLADRIAPILAGNPPGAQGAALASLLAMHLAGHMLMGPEAIKSILNLHIEKVVELVPFCIAELRDRQVKH